MSSYPFQYQDSESIKELFNIDNMQDQVKRGKDQEVVPPQEENSILPCRWRDPLRP